jgi:hypothetical protein
MDATEETQPNRRRVWITLSALIVVIALAILGAIFVPPLLAGTPSTEPTASATPTTPPRDIVDPDAPRPTQTPTPAAGATDEPFAELSPVAPDQTIVTEEGIEISLSSLQAVDGQATLAGETSGPAIRATVRITNTGDEPLDLEYVAVNAYIGEDRAPAGTLTQPGGAPFEGTVAPGDSAEGTYLFTVPETDRDDVTLTVDYLFGAKVAVFRGDLR